MTLMSPNEDRRSQHGDRTPGYGPDPNEMTSPRRSITPKLVLTGSLVLLLAAVLFNRADLFGTSSPPAEPRPITARGDLAADEQNTIELFDRCARSVVYVSPKVRHRKRTIFGVYDVIEQGTGSGFIWDDRGHLVTNSHVIEGASGCSVTLPDNSTYEAELIGDWPDMDIAVLRIKAPKEQLVPIVVGTSSNLRVGQKVFAIGNPFGLDFTLTTGVVSALNREIRSVTGRTIQGVIQTDAAINPGSSGGPLLDSGGRLIGMNTMIYSQSGSSAGIGFAVPVDTINRIVPQLISYGKVIRPGLGVNIAGDDVAERLGLEGVLILGVADGSAAERAGLQPTMETRDGRIVLGDIIVRVGDTPTPDRNALLNALEKYEIGETVDVTVKRQGRTKTVSVTLQAIE